MILVSRRIKSTCLGGRMFRIVVVRLYEFLDVIDCVIRVIEEIFVRCRSVDEAIESSVLYVLIDVFHLEVHCLRF